jgi:hypothetical protein
LRLAPFSATTIWVPLPQNGSNARSPASESSQEQVSVTA